MNKRYILKKLHQETSKLMIGPYLGLPKKMFEQQSYRKWAVKMVLRAIENSDLPPIMVVEEFADKMDEFACMKGGGKFMFSVAHDTAMWILDLLA